MQFKLYIVSGLSYKLIRKIHTSWSLTRRNHLASLFIFSYSWDAKFLSFKTFNICCPYGHQIKVCAYEWDSANVCGCCVKIILVCHVHMWEILTVNWVGPFSVWHRHLGRIIINYFLQINTNVIAAIQFILCCTNVFMHWFKYKYLRVYI